MDREFWVGVGEPAPSPLHSGTGHKADTDVEEYERLPRSLELLQGLNRESMLTQALWPLTKPIQSRAPYLWGFL